MEKTKLTTFMNYRNILQSILSLVICVLLVMAVSIRRDGKIMGYDLQAKKHVVNGNVGDTLRVLEDGTTIVNTTELAKDIVGYGGIVPLEISLKEGKVVKIDALKNSETPAFFQKASELLTVWNGKDIDEAQRMTVDVVSGATLSSNAIIGNVQRGLSYASMKNTKSSMLDKFELSAKSIVGLLVALMAAVLPLIIKNRRYRMFQQILNVVVLGFWCGTFLNYTSIINYMSNGMNLLTLLVPVVMLITAFVYPLLGKKSYYCTNVCPFGALQELSGKCVRYKIKMKPATVKRLDRLRQLLWAFLMIMLWTGAWFDWIDYEPFSAFIIQSASWVVIVIAVVFVALSTVIIRPYCRFVCPTGSLLKFSQFSRKIIHK